MVSWNRGSKFVHLLRASSPEKLCRFADLLLKEFYRQEGFPPAFPPPLYHLLWDFTTPVFRQVT